MKTLWKKDFTVKKIDELSAKNGSETKIYERVKILNKKLDEFVQSYMETVN